MRLTFLALLLMVGLACAQEGSTETQKVSSQAHQQAQNPEEKLSLDGRALAVVNSYAKEIKEEIGNYDWGILFVNAVLAVATGLLFWQTLKLAKQAKADSKRQEDEVKESLGISRNGVDISRITAQQAQSASFLDLYPIVEKHHTPEIAQLRRFARDELPRKCAAAREKGVSLKEYDGEAARTAGDVANYYESIGMLVEFGETKILPEVTALLLDMVHVSTYDIWEIYYDNLDVIYPHPEGMDEWAGSFEYLYHLVSRKYVHPNPPRPLLDRPKKRTLKEFPPLP